MYLFVDINNWTRSIIYMYQVSYIIDLHSFIIILVVIIMKIVDFFVLYIILIYEFSPTAVVLGIEQGIFWRRSGVFATGCSAGWCLRRNLFLQMSCLGMVVIWSWSWSYSLHFTSFHFKSVALFSVIVLLRDYFSIWWSGMRFTGMYVLSFEFIVTTTFVLCRYLLFKAKEIKCG